MSELKQFRLPDVGEGLTEADIVKWHVKPGDPVVINQIIVDIETAKAVVELPCPYDGVVFELLVPEGTTADVGTPIIAIEAGAPAPGELPSAPAAADPLRETAAAPERAPARPEDAQSPEQKQERQPVLVGYGVKLGSTTRRPRKSPADSSAPAVAVSVPARATSAVLAKPPVRKMAKDLGVDLAALTGTGPNGSVTRQDIQAAAGLGGEEGTAPVAASPALFRPASAGPREERIPIRGVRKHTAAAMASSAFTAPHVTEFLQIDISETMTAVERLRSLPEFEGIRVSPLLLVAKALLVTAARHPLINSSWDQESQEIVVKHYVNLGIAAATDRGLLVPSVKDAHALSLPGLAHALNELAQAARSGKSTLADLSGGTITITNVGIFGVDTGTPIITPGEAAILAFGQVKQAPWVYEGQLAVRQVCTLALSFDHRIVDGDLGSRVLREVGSMLTDPLRMLAWS